MSDLVDPASRFERLENSARDDNAAYCLDVTARHRLPVCNDRESLQDRTGIFRWAVRVQAIQKFLVFGANLKPPSACHIGKLNAFSCPIRSQLFQYATQHINSDLLVE